MFRAYAETWLSQVRAEFYLLKLEVNRSYRSNLHSEYNSNISSVKHPNTNRATSIKRERKRDVSKG